MGRPRRHLIILLFAAAGLGLCASACDPPKSHQDEKREAMLSTRMAHLRLELWQEIRLQRLSSDGASVELKPLKTFTTDPVVFDFWVGRAEDVKAYAEHDGRVAFIRFSKFLADQHSIEAASWGFDANFDLQTGESESSDVRVAGWPYTNHSELKLDTGQNVERQLAGWTDSAKDPSVAYVPVARLTLVETKNYGDRTKRDAKLLVKIPPKMREELKQDREAFAKGATTLPATRE
jgi:hypothetical protein